MYQLIEHIDFVLEEADEISSNENLKFCLCCGEPIKGRSDKKFCNMYCRSQYHYAQTKESTPQFYVQIQQQLSTNRRILKNFNKAGKATVRDYVLRKEGFNPRVFTHYWRNSKNGLLYFFVFEYGFAIINEHGYKKFVLIQWQKYMNI